MSRYSLPVLKKSLLAIALGTAFLVGCEDKGSPEGGASEPDLTAVDSDSAAASEGAGEDIRYPEFERQQRVERIAALGAVQKEGKENFAICAACHGMEGFGSRDGVVPRLAGQQEKVVIEKLVEISEGVRHRPEMEPWLSSIDTDDKIGALASYISAMPDPVRSLQGTGRALDMGKRVFEDYCISCHGPSGAGDGDARVPRIAGWDYVSVRRTLIRQGADRDEIHETGMSDLVSILNEGEIDALSDYVSRLVSVPASAAKEP